VFLAGYVDSATSSPALQGGGQTTFSLTFIK
jgi:hypothetical protein